MNYWQECVEEVLYYVGITATQEQIETIASWVEGAHDNYGMAHGYDEFEKLRNQRWHDTFNAVIAAGSHPDSEGWIDRLILRATNIANAAHGEVSDE